jgi:hypothetical protein
MKRKRFILFATLLFIASFSMAQKNGNWQPVMFISGTSSFNGVDAYCMPDTCNGIQSILLKFVNNNTYTIRAGWKDMLVTKANQQLTANLVQDSVTIGPNSNVSGNCAGNSGQLVLKLSDFGTDISNFNYLIVLDFNFVTVH